LVCRRQRHGVKATLWVGELRLEAREIHDSESITGLRVGRPAVDIQMVLAEVRLDVVRGVQPREVDPRLVARVRVVAGTLDEHADLRECEEIAAGEDV
jgi:hypothetical protein